MFEDVLDVGIESHRGDIPIQWPDIKRVIIRFFQETVDGDSGVHNFKYMLDDASKQEVLRLASPKTGRANMLARWENVLNQWNDGKTMEEIGEWIGRKPSTVRRLIKRAALERQKQPGFAWPVDSHGRKICDVAHPMPHTERPSDWVHARLNKRKFNTRPALSGQRQPVRVGYCPVCQHGGLLERPTFFKGKPLIEVLVNDRITQTIVDKLHEL